MICCKISGVIAIGLAAIACIVSLSTSWTVGRVSSSPILVGGSFEETIYLSLWRRRVERSNGNDESSSWKNYTEPRKDEKYCPEEAGATYGDVFTQIQAAQACAVIALLATVVTLVIGILNILPCISSRLSFAIPGAIAIAFACGSLIAWGEFYNICTENFCTIYTNQAGAEEGVCGMSVGFGFMCVCIGLNLIGILQLCV